MTVGAQVHQVGLRIHLSHILRERLEVVDLGVALCEADTEVLWKFEVHTAEDIFSSFSTKPTHKITEGLYGGSSL